MRRTIEANNVSASGAAIRAKASRLVASVARAIAVIADGDDLRAA